MAASYMLRRLGLREFSGSSSLPPPSLSSWPVRLSPVRSPEVWIRVLPVRFASTINGNGTTYKHPREELEDSKKHHVPTTFVDILANNTVKCICLLTDIFFQRRYGCRAVMLETVASVPGTVGATFLNLRHPDRFEHKEEWIRMLSEEAENERMHLTAFAEAAASRPPRRHERALAKAARGACFAAHSLAYIVSPEFAHRVVGYLKEEAVRSYTELLEDIDGGAVENVPAPAVAIDYWRLPPDATLRDVVAAMRADEARHRDANHFASVNMFCNTNGERSRIRGFVVSTRDFVVSTCKFVVAVAAFSIAYPHTRVLTLMVMTYALKLYVPPYLWVIIFHSDLARQRRRW